MTVRGQPYQHPEDTFPENYNYRFTGNERVVALKLEEYGLIKSIDKEKRHFKQTKKGEKIGLKLLFSGF